MRQIVSVSALLLSIYLSAFAAPPVLTPEPGTGVLIGIGLLVGAGVARVRRRR